MTPRRLFHFSGPAATLRALGQLRRGVSAEAQAAHAAHAARVCANLAARGPAVWAHGAREFRADVARLQGYVESEVRE